MTTPARAAAARANGAKSRGPVTAQGKANSARNSLRHGLRARLLFNDGKFEPERQAILAELTHDLNPESETERRLVETIANAHWSQQRLWRLEAELFNAEMRRLNCTAAQAFRSLAEHTCALELLGRFEARYSRQYLSALTRLHQLQNDRLSSPENTIVDGRTQQLIENKGTADQAQRPEASARQTFVGQFPQNEPAKCVFAQAPIP